ncbi:MAG: YheT family hydrolase [Gemmatimonadota bacterium]
MPPTEVLDNTARGGPEWARSPFRPPWWLSGPHLQTLAGRRLRPRSGVHYRRERIETPDGDFLDLDFASGGDGRSGGGPSPFVLLLHGLEGSSSSGYMLESCRLLAGRGLRPIALNFRSRSGEPNLTRRFYHSGETGDLDHAIGVLANRLPDAEFGILGYSLGGNVLLKYLGERGEETHPRLRAACAVSVPFDLAASARHLQRGLGRLYSRLFLRSLRRNIRAKAALFPGAYDLQAAARARTLWEFDDAVTAPVHGFVDAADYYSRSSSAAYLTRIRVPTLLLQAADDPFVPRDSLPVASMRANPWLSAALTRRGGHLGFVTRDRAGRWVFWAEREAARFLASHLTPSARCFGVGKSRGDGTAPPAGERRPRPSSPERSGTHHVPPPTGSRRYQAELSTGSRADRTP